MFWWTDPILPEHLEIFAVGLWFTPAAMPSSSTATSAKLDAQGLPLGHFVGVSKSGKWPNRGPLNYEILCRSVDLSGTLSDTGQRTFLAKIIGRVCRSSTGVYNPE